MATSCQESEKMIYVVHNSEQSGPHPEEEIRQKLTSGDFLPTDLAWKEGMEKWEPIVMSCHRLTRTRRKR